MVNLKMNLFLRLFVLLAYELQLIPIPLDLYGFFSPVNQLYFIYLMDLPVHMKYADFPGSHKKYYRSSIKN